MTMSSWSCSRPVYFFRDDLTSPASVETSTSEDTLPPPPLYPYRSSSDVLPRRDSGPLLVLHRFRLLFLRIRYPSTPSSTTWSSVPSFPTLLKVLLHYKRGVDFSLPLFVPTSEPQGHEKEMSKCGTICVQGRRHPSLSGPTPTSDILPCPPSTFRASRSLPRKHSYLCERVYPSPSLSVSCLS